MNELNYFSAVYVQFALNRLPSPAGALRLNLHAMAFA